MEPASPSSYSHEYFIGQPDFTNYESPVPYDAVPAVEGMHISYPRNHRLFAYVAF